jgi:ERCC4-related helicase
VHINTHHKHIHLYVNRIDYSGKAYDDQFISNRSAHVAESIAKVIGLQTAREVQQVRDQQRQVEHPEIRHIKELAKTTLEHQEARSVTKFTHLFNQAGAKDGLRAEAYNNKNGSF